MHRTISVLQYDAFTDIPLAGNPAGVVLEADSLDANDMQLIARELNCSETVFIMASESADYRMRYFTPSVEVDLCGHATISGLTALAEARDLRHQVSIETNAGTLAMEVRADGSAWMQQAKPQFQSIETRACQIVMELLGTTPGALPGAVQPGLSFTGLWDLMVPINSLETLMSLEPDMNGLAAFNRSLGVASTHVFCLETKTAHATLHARDFSPAVGIPEDPHTGTASGALGAFLVHQGVLKPGEFVFEQGWSVGRPGFIQVRVDSAEEPVWVGGRATRVLAGEMVLGERVKDA